MMSINKGRISYPLLTKDVEYYIKLAMITEKPAGNMLGRVFNIILHDPDLYTKYEIPANVSDVLHYRDHILIPIKGTRNDLQVRGLRVKGFSFNQLTPPETKFGISEYQNMVRTDVEGQRITIPAQKRYRDALVFGLFHAIGRLHVHVDPVWHEKSIEAHHLLNNSISHLRAYGKVKLSDSLIDRTKELEAWKVVCEEEQKVSIRALQLIADLIARGMHPIDHIKDMKQLEQMVNSNHLLRTKLQYEMDPRWTERQIGIPMTLTTKQISEILHV